jgi:hypothetical protein
LACVLALGLSLPVFVSASPASDADALLVQARRNKIEFGAPVQIRLEWRSDHVPATVPAVNGALRKHGFTFSVEVAKPNAGKAAHVLSARKLGSLSEKDLSALVQEVESQSGGIGTFAWSIVQK